MQSQIQQLFSQSTLEQLYTQTENQNQHQNKNDISFDAKQNSNSSIFKVRPNISNISISVNSKKCNNHPPKNSQIQIYQERIRQLEARLIVKNNMAKSQKSKRQLMLKDVEQQLHTQKMQQTILDKQCQIIHLQTQLTIAQKQLQKVEELLLKRTNNYQTQLAKHQQKIKALVLQKQQLKCQYLSVQQTVYTLKSKNDEVLLVVKELEAKISNDINFVNNKSKQDVQKLTSLQKSHEQQLKQLQSKYKSKVKQLQQKLKQMEINYKQKGHKQDQSNNIQIQSNFCRNLLDQINNNNTDTLKFSLNFNQQKLCIQYLAFLLMAQIKKLNQESEDRYKHFQTEKNEQVLKLNNELTIMASNNSLLQQELKFYKEKYQQNNTFSQLLNIQKSRTPIERNKSQAHNRITKISKFQDTQRQQSDNQKIHNEVKQRRKRLLSYQSSERRRNCTQTYPQNQILNNIQMNNNKSPFNILKQSNLLMVNNKFSSNYTTSPVFSKQKQTSIKENLPIQFLRSQKSCQHLLQTHLSQQNLKQKSYQISDFIIEKTTPKQINAKMLTQIKLQEYSKRQSIQSIIKNDKILHNKNNEQSTTIQQQKQKGQHQRMQRCKSLPSSQMSRGTISIKDLIAQKCTKKLAIRS